MFQPSSPFNGLTKVFLVLVAIGAVAAFASSNSDLANPITRFVEAWGNLQKADQINKINQVEANAEIDKQKEITAIDLKIKEAEAKEKIAKIVAEQAAYPKWYEQQLQHQAQQATLELENSRQQAAFELENLRQKAALDLENSRQQAAFDLEMSRLFEYGKITIGVILAICFSIVTIQFGRSRLVLAQTQAQVRRIDGWQDPIWRKNQINLARRREQIMRASYAPQPQTTVVTAPYADQEAPISWEEIRQQFAQARKNQKNSQ